MTAWWKLCIGGFATIMLVACQSDKNPEQTTADSTTIAAGTAVITTDTNLAPVDATPASQADTGNTVTTTVVTQETNAPAATKTTTTTTTATSAAPASEKTTVKPVPEPPARTETISQPVPEKKPVEPAPTRGTETVKPEPPVTTSTETASDPKAIFLQEKCSSCHSITSAGIASKVQRDLSGIGAKHSESWITQFLQQQVELDGKKHKKTFKGTDGELKMVARWLAAMK